MKKVKYITPQQAIFYQQKIIKITGGSLGLRDLGQNLPLTGYGQLMKKAILFDIDGTILDTVGVT